MSVTVSPYPFLFFMNPNNSGSPAAGFQLFTYIAGTSTKQTTWTDSTQLVSNTNPIVLDANGAAYVWLDPTLIYKYVLAPPNDTDPPTSPLRSIDNLEGPITNRVFGQFSIIYPQTAAEIAASITPVSIQFPPGDIRRYGADPTGGAASDTAILNALLSNAEVFIPPGQFLANNQVIVPTGKTIYGVGREGTTWTNAGTSSAFKLINQASGSNSIPNLSGFGFTTLYGFTISNANPANAQAVLEINACGFSYYNVHDMRLTGTGRFGLIIDGAEVSRFYANVIDVASSTAGTNTPTAAIWLTSGPDRTTGQSQGFTNNITIQDSQINNCYYGILDDGGSNHNFIGNNINGAMVPFRLTSVIGGVILGHEIENVYAAYFGGANILFSDVSLSGAVTSPQTQPPTGGSLGACQGILISGNTFGGNCATSSSTIAFRTTVNTTFHTGITLQSNWFRFNAGVVSTIDCVQLASSFCGFNVDTATVAVNHYANTHQDTNGNVLYPPQVGSSVSFTQAAYLFGDSRFPASFTAGVKIGTNASFMTSTVAMVNGAGAQTGTLTTAPSAGNPTKWIGFNDNGTIRYIPSW
jgi:hypothetical protein